MSCEQRQEIKNQAKRYEEELLALPSAELTALVEQEQKKAIELAQLRRDREEQERFFNQPYVNADFVHWSKAAHWTLDEAVALSFGKAPENVKWASVKPLVQISAFAAQYARIRDLTLRAKAWKQLYDPVLPTIFLAWAKRTDISYPAELEKQLTARGLQVADWKSLYDELKKKHDDYTAVAKACVAELNGDVERLTRELTESRERQAELARAMEASAANEKPLGTRERDTLLRLIIGMAVSGYGYNPRAIRSDTVTEIVSDLDKQGLHLDPDTVRKWLRVAAESLPPESETD